VPIVPSKKAVIAGVFTGYTHEKIVVSTAAIGFTVSNLTSGSRIAQVVHVTVEEQALNYKYDGGTPTSTSGHAAAAGAVVTIAGYKNITNFLAIRSGGSDSKISVTYEA
jgi:hypothetical protein